MKLRGMLLGVLALALGACAATSEPSDEGSTDQAATSTACSDTSKRTDALQLFVEPDAGPQPFVDTLNSATKTIDFMVYQMGKGPILDTLIAKAKAGVKVRGILDVSQKPVNQQYFTQLTAAGADIIWSDPQFSFMHAKYMVADSTEALISTGNYALSQIEVERNYAARDTDPADVATLETLFNADFARAVPSIACTRLIVSPVNSRQRLIDFINSATKSIVIESMQFADAGIRAAVVAKKNAGLDVRIILAETSWIAGNVDAVAYLRANGIEPRAYPHAHVKSIVVDGTAAYIGSINLSGTSIGHNREVGLLVTEPDNVAKIVSTFEHDWAVDETFAPSTGDAGAPVAATAMEAPSDADGADNASEAEAGGE